MSRIDATFTALQAQGRKALIPFVTAGYPYADVTPELMHAMVAGGADVIELGVPFSDPSADGPVIQKAGDKDIGTVADLSNGEFFCRPSCTGQSVKGNVVAAPVKRAWAATKYIA